MRVYVSIKDKGATNFVAQAIKEVELLAASDVERLAKECERVIKNTIETNCEKTTGRLAEAWFAEKLSLPVGQYGWGVGDIEHLNTTVPYWRHCLSEDTEVYIYFENRLIPCSLKDLFSLWKMNQNIEILTPNGLKSIVNMRDVWEQEYYNFQFARYFNVKMSKNHKLIYKLNGRLIEKEAQTFGSSLMAYSGVYTGLKIDKDFFQTKLEIDNIKLDLNYLYGWIIGFTLAEGHVSPKDNRITWTQKNILNIQDKLQSFAQLFNYDLKIYPQDNRTCFCIYNSTIYKFIHYFCSGIKNKKKITHFYLNTPKDFRKGILDGYNAGDGRKADLNKYHIRTISKEMRKQFMLIGASLGYDISLLQNQKSSLKSFKSNYPIYSAYIYSYCRRWQVNNFQAQKIFKEKKYCQKNLKGQFIRNIGNEVNFKYFPKSVIKIDKITSYNRFIDLAVDGELFLINGGLVSHNCNYGSVAIGADWEHWLPKGRWVNGRWIEDEDGYFAKPKTPLPARNFIEDTLAQMEIFIQKVVAEK